MADLDREQARGQTSTGNQSLDGDLTSSSLSFGAANHMTGGSRNTNAQKVPKTAKTTKPAKPIKPTHSSSRSKDPVLRGFLSSAATCHVERKQLALRLRARLVAVETALAGERRFTLPEIAERVGTSTRTLNMQFGVKDALFAFPPPELVPVLFDCWLSASDGSDASGLNETLTRTFHELDQNPLARSLFHGLARLHSELPKLLLADGYFNAALRQQIVQHESVSRSCLGWSGYITDALRDTFQEWATCLPADASLESIAPNLMIRLRPIGFL